MLRCDRDTQSIHLLIDTSFTLDAHSNENCGRWDYLYGRVVMTVGQESDLELANHPAHSGLGGRGLPFVTVTPPLLALGPPLPLPLPLPSPERWSRTTGLGVLMTL